MKRNASLATLLILGALPLAAISADQAQSPTSRPAAETAPAYRPASAAKEAVPPLFQQLDMNHDGYITKDEAKRSADFTARFAGLDSDHDGRISVSEFKKGMQSNQ